LRGKASSPKPSFAIVGPDQTGLRALVTRSMRSITSISLPASIRFLILIWTISEFAASEFEGSVYRPDEQVHAPKQVHGDVFQLGSHLI
jgi:hypothetical protein